MYFERLKYESEKEIGVKGRSSSKAFIEAVSRRPA
jgi:hypothetical protein